MPRCNIGINDILNNKYIIKKQIGNGAYGDVFLGYDINNNKDIAIKVHNNDNKYKNSINTEYNIYNELNKIIKKSNIKYYIPKLYETIYCNNFDCFILKLYGPNLYKFMKDNYFTEKYTIDFLTKLCKNLLLGMNFLVDNNIIHCDLKPENLLFNIEETDIVICDFGMSKKSTNIYELYYNEIQTLWYRAPEISLKLKYNNKIDTWSIGCIFYEMLLNEVLFRSKKDKNHIINIYNILGLPTDRYILENNIFKNIDTSKLYTTPSINVEKLEYKYKDVSKIISIMNCFNDIIKWSSNERPTYTKLLEYFN